MMHDALDNHHGAGSMSKNLTAMRPFPIIGKRRWRERSMQIRVAVC